MGYVLLVRVIMLFGLKMASTSSEDRHGSKLSSGDIVRSLGGNVKEYQVQTCLGKGNYGEVWTLHASDHLLKFHNSAHLLWPIASECLFGKIAVQKDSAHFATCFDHGPGEVWTLEDSDLVLKYRWKGGYSIWQKMDGQKVSALTNSSNVEDFEKVFPDLNSVFGYLTQLFHIFDALQKPGTIAPGIGVRQWHLDAHPSNILASAEGLVLIDYGINLQCCSDPQDCAVESGFADVQIEPCRGTRTLGTLQAGSTCMQCCSDPQECVVESMLEFMLDVVFRPTFGFRSHWFQQLHNTSLESLVMELRSSSGPSREMFQNQWCLQNANVILGMASAFHEGHVQWPPAFMEEVKLALKNLPLRTSIVQEVPNVEM